MANWNKIIIGGLIIAKAIKDLNDLINMEDETKIYPNANNWNTNNNINP